MESFSVRTIGVFLPINSPNFCPGKYQYFLTAKTSRTLGDRPYYRAIVSKNSWLNCPTNLETKQDVLCTLRKMRGVGIEKAKLCIAWENIEKPWLAWKMP
jgi:hypothetical protein